MAKKTIFRSSITGRIISKANAKSHPRTTERERVRVPTHRKGK
jgi:hypothetical protein